MAPKKRNEQAGRLRKLGTCFMSFAFLGALGLAFSSSRSQAAEFKWHEGDLYIVGTIESGDSEQFLYSLANGTTEPRSIKLRSPGGLASEALEIGRMIRRYRLVTSAPTKPLDRFYCPGELGQVHTKQGNCVCASACAMVWFGGIMRFGSVGVHRSYFSSPRGSFEKYEEDLQASYDGVINYLEEMRVPSWVEDKIFETSSEEIAIIYAAIPKAPFKPWEQQPIAIDAVFQEYALAMCGDETAPFYENMGCYVDAAAKAQHERSDARWYDTAQTYLAAFPKLNDEPYLTYFDAQVRDITSSADFMTDNWLDQLGRAHQRTASEFAEIEKPTWLNQSANDD